MNAQDIDVLIREFAPVVREYVDKRLADVEKQAPLPVDDPMPELKQYIDSIISEVELPRDGEKGDKGDSVAIEDVQRMIADEVAKIPAPRDGRDALQQIDPESIKRAIDSAVAEQMPRIEFDGERTLTIINQKTAETYSLDFLSYREVYKAETDYAKGDVVTFGGSMWHCMEACKDVKPGQGDNWKLCVKKGRDGK